jgi:hypothetical protein
MNGCFNRSPLKTSVVVQSGHFMDGITRTPRMVSIPDPMSKDCQYSKDDKYNDQGCVGCAHKLTTERKA